MGTLILCACVVSKMKCMKKRFLLLAGCFFALSAGLNAQELFIDDFEGEAKDWQVIGDAALTVESNPFPDAMNSSAKVLKVVCEGPDGAIYNGISGPILNQLAIPVGMGAGQYRYAHVKVYYGQTETLVLSLESGPSDNFGSPWSDVGTGNLNKWVDLVIDCQGAPAGNYGTIFVMPGRINSEEWYGDKKASQVFYLDDIRFSNDPNPYNPNPTPNPIPEPTDDYAVLDNFENGLVNFSSQLNEMADASFSVVENPSKSGINTSDKVLQVTRNADNTGAWAGFWADLTVASVPRCDMNKYHYAHFKLLQDIGADGLTASFKVEGGAGTPPALEMNAMNGSILVNEWQDVIFDLTAADGGGEYTRIAVMPDRADNRPAHSVYIDDIIFTKTQNLPSGISNVLAVINSIKVNVEGNVTDITFNLEQTAVTNVSVYNISGQLMDRQVINGINGINSVKTVVNTPGVYVVKVAVGNKALVTKFIK